MKNKTPEDRPSYDEWLRSVNVMTRTRYFMTIYELEDEIPREVLRKAYETSISAETFVCTYVTPVFYPERKKPA